MFYYRLSRIRTYIRDLEGPCPDPLDDKPVFTYWAVLDLNQWPSACKADALPLS